MSDPKRSSIDRLAAIDRRLDEIMRGATLLARPAESEEGHVVVRVMLSANGEVSPIVEVGTSNPKVR